MALDAFFAVLNLLVYYFISKTFHGIHTNQLGGAPDYFAFAVVGVVITMVVNAASNGLTRQVREEQLTGTLEALLSQPLTSSELSLGLGGLAFLLAMFRGSLYLLIAGAILGVDFSHASWIGFVALLFTSAAALTGLGIIAGALVLVVKRAELIVGIVTYGLGLLGGAFFPVAVLPGWLRPLADIVPTKFAFDGLRAALFKGGAWGGDALALLGFAVVLAPLGILLFELALAQARRSGSLSQY